MARLEEREYTYFTTVRGMCRGCREIVPARVFFRDGKVFQQSLCSVCGGEPALIAGDQTWYLENVVRPMPDRSPLNKSQPPARGCPGDCGPCTWHASPCQLPVISITNACNLSCPICFTYNRKDPPYFISPDEMSRTADWIVESSGKVDLINITGGEPTLHPQLPEIIEACARPEIGRVTMNSNGLNLAQDKALCRMLADKGVYVILSFNTHAAAVSEKIHGRDLVETKLRAIDNLTDAGVRITLLNVMMRDTNEEAAGGILDMMLENDNILSMVVQTMTYTGQGGGRWPDRRHIPVDEAAAIICRNSKNRLEPADFVTRPSAHPLCYLTCYMLKSGDRLLPLARYAPPDAIKSMMRDSYLMRLENEEQFFRDIINELYSRNETGELKAFRKLTEQLFPAGDSPDEFERQRTAESAVRTIYVHAHMDEDTFDCSRAMMCPDMVPSEPGRLIPACTYNLFYRMQDERFYEAGE